MFIEKNKIYSVNGYSFINFINLNEDEVSLILEWRNNASIRRYMYNKDIISIENHISFVKSLNIRSDAYYWLVKKNDKNIGVINLTSIDFNLSKAELGYYMVPDMMNSGMGLDFVYSNFLFAFTEIYCSKLIGNIHFDNKNALLLDKYLGCNLGEIKNIFSEKGEVDKYISWEISKSTFINDSIDKNNIRNFVEFLKMNS